MSAPRAVTVDLWYTMVYFDPAERTRYEAARRRAWLDPVEAAGVRPRAAETAVVGVENWARAREATGRAVHMEELGAELRRRTGVRTDAVEIGSEIRDALRATPLRWMPGARAAVAQLRRRGLRMGVVSNILHEPPEIAHDVLARPGAPGPFDTVVVSSEGPYAKPAPQILRQALTQLDVPGVDALHIGDSTADLLAADRAGVRFVRFRGTPRAPKPGPRVPPGEPRHPAIRRWEEFPRRFEELWATGGLARERVLMRARSGRGRRGRRAAPRTRSR